MKKGFRVPKQGRWRTPVPVTDPDWQYLIGEHYNVERHKKTGGASDKELRWIAVFAYRRACLALFNKDWMRASA